MTPPETGPKAQGASSQELINHLLANGWTYAAIGRELQRHPSGLARIAIGDKEGSNLRTSLQQLVTTGTVTAPVPRRTTKSGQPVKVRGKSGQPSVVPPDAQAIVPAAAGTTKKGRKPARADLSKPPRGLVIQHKTPQAPRSVLAPPEQVKPGKSKFNESLLPHPTGVLYRMTVPKTEGEGRERGRQSLLEQMRKAKEAIKRLTFTVTLDDDKVVPIGSKRGYAADDAVLRAESEGDDPLAWLEGEVDGIEHYDTEEAVIVGVQMVSFD